MGQFIRQFMNSPGEAEKSVENSEKHDDLCVDLMVAKGNKSAI